MATWQARCFSLVIRIVIRRREWSAPGEPEALARRARRVFGAPGFYGWLVTRGLRQEVVRNSTVRGEWISAPSPDAGVILYVHGGGFVACSPATHRPITAALARLTRRRVFSVDYRLAPEHQFPAAQNDTLAAFDWLLSTGVAPADIALAGDSAGGNLVLGLAVALREERRALPACVIAFSPWTDLAGTSKSVQTNDGRCVMFRSGNMAEFAAAALGATPPTLPAASPAYADPRGLPPVLLHVSSTELLLDDSLRVADRIRAAGGTCEVDVYDNVTHCWQMLVGLVPEAKRSLRAAAAFARKHSAQPRGGTAPAI